MKAIAGRRLIAPLVAGLLIGLLYLSRVDSNFYFLWGLESQGILLSEAMAEGRGMIDLSLPGHPAHVREPPLFYFILSLCIRAFGVKMLPMKLVMWAGYALAAGLITALWQRRVPPWLAASAAVFALATPELFRTATGPKSDLPFAAVALAALLLAETVAGRVGAEWGRRDWGRAAGAGLLLAAAVMMRSLGLAALLAALGAVFYRTGRGDWRCGVRPALWLLLPTVLAVGAWSARGAALDNPAGYNYIDWFLMDMEPDSPEMTAVDFHSPLMGPVPRMSVGAAVWRSVSHLPYYGALYGGLLFGAEAGPLRHWGIGRLFLLLLPVMGLGMWSVERGRPLVLPLFLLFYSLVLLTWPMNDQRLTYPLLPLTGGYLIFGLARVGSIGRSSADSSGIGRRGAVIAVALLSPALAWNLYGNYNYHRQMAALPGIELRPGFTVRFLSSETMRSFRLLTRARQIAPPGAVLMYHSPPPCRLVTGHECQAIPFTPDLKRVRDYLTDGGADYLVVDEWGRIYPGGPGWLTENILRPTVSAFPADFELVYSAGADAGVWRVRRR